MSRIIVLLPDGRYVGEEGQPTYARSLAHEFHNQTAAAFHVEGALNIDVRSVVFLPVVENGKSCGCDPAAWHICEWHRTEAQPS